MVLTLGHDLGTQGGFGAHAQSFVIVLMNVKLFLDLFDFVHSNFARLFKAVGNFERVDTLVEKFLGLLEDRTCKHNHTSRTVTDLVVLRGRQFSQKTSSLMVNLHLLQNGGSIVSDDNLTVGTIVEKIEIVRDPLFFGKFLDFYKIGGQKIQTSKNSPFIKKRKKIALPDEHFVHAFRSEGGLHETGNCASCHNINLHKVKVKSKGLENLSFEKTLVDMGGKW